MFRNGFFILIILLLAFPALAQDDDFTEPTCDMDRYAYANHMDKGGFYLGRGEYMRAVTEYTCAIILRPGDALAYNSRGKALVEIGEFDLALLDYNHALEIDPNFVRAYNNRGWAYYGLREYNLALQEFDEAISRDPNYALAYNNRGVVYHRLEENEQAISDYQQAIDLGLEPLSMGLINLGLVYTRVQDTRAAIDSFEAALRDDPDNASARWWLGNAYYELKDYTRARENYQAYADLVGESGALEPLERLNEMSTYQTFIRVLPTLVIVVIIGTFVVVQGVRYWRKRRQGEQPAEYGFGGKSAGSSRFGGTGSRFGRSSREQSTTSRYGAKRTGYSQMRRASRERRSTENPFSEEPTSSSRFGRGDRERRSPASHYIAKRAEAARRRNAGREEQPTEYRFDPKSTTSRFDARLRGEATGEPVEQQESHTLEMQTEPSQKGRFMRLTLGISSVAALLAMGVVYAARRALGQPDTDHSSS